MVTKCWKTNKDKNRFKSPKNKKVCSDVVSQAEPITETNEYDTALQAAKWTFLEYFKESSIHGFKYIGNRRHSVADRVMWLCALILSVITCCFLIRNVWDKRINNPVIVSFNEKQTPVWEIPFPTVTICPETKTETGIFNYTKMLWKIAEMDNIDEKEQFYWEAISQTCVINNEDTLSYGNRFANASDLIRSLKETSPTLYDVVMGCTWRQSHDSCHTEFQTVLTEEGICFSFNSLTSNYYRDELIDAHIQDDSFYDADIASALKWNVEKGYNMVEDLDIIPKRVIGASRTESLLLVLASRTTNEDLLCRAGLQGFKFILHTPGEEPQVSKKFIHVPFDKSVLISIKPKIVGTSEGLQGYEPHRRQCYYQNERYLRYFKVYSKPNCELECQANRTLVECGCVKFSMPRNSSHPVCGSTSRDCIKLAVNDVDKMNFIKAHRLNQSDDSDISCNCFPLCTSVEYKAELASQTEFDYIKQSRALKFFEFFEIDPGYQVTKIYIHFKEEIFNGLKRSELYSKSDFVANCGGLLGLFMGVSILSLVEFVYFFTVKLWANLKKKKMEDKHLKKINESP